MSQDCQIKIVALNFPVCSKLQVQKSSEGFQLIGWRDQHIYISNFTSEEINGETNKPHLTCSFDQLVAEGDIKGVFSHKETTYVVDSEGNLYELKKSSVQDDDIFEDSPKYVLRWELQNVAKFIDEGKVLCSCLIKDGFAVLLQNDSQIILHLYYHGRTPSKQAIIHQYTSSEEKICGCHVAYIEEKDVSVNFVRHWFPEIGCHSGGLIVLVLPESIVCGVFANEEILKPLFFFDWPFKAVHIDWKDFLFQGGESSRNKYLTIFFHGGSIVALGPYGKHVMHYPLTNVKNLFVSKTILFSTDFSDCYASNISLDSEATLLPIKGIVGFCEIPNTNNILVSTRHRTLYNWAIETPHKTEEFKMPQLSVLDDLLRFTDYLEQLSLEIQIHDKYINALSCSANGANFNFNFSIQIISISGYDHTLRLFLTTDMPGLQFSSNVWHLALSVSSSDFNTSLVQELQSDFSKDFPLEQFLKLRIEGTDRFFDISASLVSFLDGGKFRPSIDIGKKNLNITYFIEPLSSGLIHSLNLSQEFNIKAILDSKKSEDDVESEIPKEEQRQFSCTISVPIEKDKISPDIFEQLLNNSKPLWRTTEWNSTVGKNQVELVIAGKCTILELKESSISIKCDEMHICYQLKLAIIALISPSFQLSGDEAVLMEIENILKCLEILEYQSEEDLNVDVLYQLFERKKKYISNKVFNAKSISSQSQ